MCALVEKLVEFFIAHSFCCQMLVLLNWSSFLLVFFLLSDAGIAPYVEENDHVKLEQSSVQRLEPAPVYAVLDFIT